MMKRVISLLLPVLVLTGCGSGGNDTTSQVPANAVKVHVTASDFKWTLDKKTFQAGVPIDFIVSSTEGTHGFSIAGTTTSQTVSQGDAPIDVVWTPDKPGTYTIMCNYFCGSGHPDMYTSITVTK